jgi:hypothetical protein
MDNMQRTVRFCPAQPHGAREGKITGFGVVDANNDDERLGGL